MSGPHGGRNEDVQFEAIPSWVGSYGEVGVVLVEVVTVVRVVDGRLDVDTEPAADVDVTEPITQYCCPATRRGQTTPGFSASKCDKVMPHVAATKSQVSPTPAVTGKVQSTPSALGRVAQLPMEAATRMWKGERWRVMMLLASRRKEI